MGYHGDVILAQIVGEIFFRKVSQTNGEWLQRVWALGLHEQAPIAGLLEALSKDESIFYAAFIVVALLWCLWTCVFKYS